MPDKKYFFLFLIVGIMMLGSACTSAPPPQVPPDSTEETASATPVTVVDDNTLRLLYWQAVTTVNPHLSGQVRDWEAGRLTYEPLASFDSDGNLVLFLAAEIPTLENGGLAEDGKSVTWKLKEGVQWADGEPFTAEDVKFTYEFVTNSAVASDSAGNYVDVESVEIIDDFTVKINFKQVTPAWAQPFVGIKGMIIPKHLFEEYNGSNAAEAPANFAPKGTGPYYVTDFVKEDVLIIGNDAVNTVKLIYEPNPFFRESDKPYFDRVELQGGGDAEVAARAVLEDGNVDYAWNVQVDVDVLNQLEALGKGLVVDNPGPFLERIWLNHSDPYQPTDEGEFSSLEFEHPFFSDVRVRQAFAYAIDREAISELYGSTGTLANNVLVARPLYQSPDVKAPDEFDLEKAAALLDEAGWIDTDGDGIRDKDGVKMKVLFQTTVNKQREAVQKIIKSALEEIGVEVELKIIEVSIFAKRDPANINSLYHFYGDMQLLFWGDPNPDPGSYLKFWTCDQIPQMSNDWSAGLNFERWCNPEYEELYQQMSTETDPENRRQTIIQMNSMLSNEVITIPLIQRALSSAVSNDIEGVKLTPWDATVWNIKDWRREAP